MSAEKRDAQRDLMKLFAYGSLANFWLNLAAMDPMPEGEAKGLFMKELDDEALSKKITALWMEGEHELRDVLMQVTFEQAHHLGEIIALLWQSNIEPPEMTWIMNTQ